MLALLEAAVDVEGMLLGGWRLSAVAGDEGRGSRDGGCGVDCVLIGEDGDGDVIVDEDLVVGDEAGDFAGVLDGAMAVAVADLDAESVLRAFAVLELDFGEHLLCSSRA